MKNTILIIQIIVISLLAYGHLKSQQSEPEPTSSHLLLKNPVGNEFWLTFMKNYREEETGHTPGSTNDLMLELFITGDYDANVNIEIKSIGFKKEIFVPGGSIQNVKIDPRAQISSFGIVERGLAVKVTSDSPISIYGLNRRYQTTDTYLGFPKEVLGEEYMAVTYYPSIALMPIFAVVATEDNTVITITPNAKTDRNQAEGKPFNITMNAGDVYQVRAADNKSNQRKADLTGSHIIANKKIALFSGHQCAYVPAGPPLIIACNHLVEQIPPISSWGKHFYVGRMEKRSFYTFRVLAAFDSTKVFIDNFLVKTLNAGQFIEENSDANLQITADKPILVAQYSQGFKNNDLIGDPMMLLISPTQQFLRQYRFATPINGQWDHFINVIAPRSAISTLELNGQRVDSTLFKPLGISRYMIAHISVPFGTHHIKAKEPIGMYSYGFGYGEDSFDAYGTMGGQSFLEYAELPDTIPPKAEYVYSDADDLVIFRDDGINDSGLKDIYVITSDGLVANIDRITEGLSQVAVSIVNPNPHVASNIVLAAYDMAENVSFHTLCYNMDKNTGMFTYELHPGSDVNCDTDPGFELGIFGLITQNFHRPDFINTGSVTSLGKFDNENGTGGYFGLSLGRRISPKFRITGKLQFQNYAAEIMALDSVIQNYRDPVTNELMSVQQSTTLNLKSLYLSLAFAGEYLFTNNYYGFGGISFNLPLNDNIEVHRQINSPARFQYENGKQKRNLNINKAESLTTMRLGLFGGFGVQFPLVHKLSVFSEVGYQYFIGNIIDDGSWKLHQLQFQIGIKYNLVNPFK